MLKTEMKIESNCQNQGGLTQLRIIQRQPKTRLKRGRGLGLDFSQRPILPFSIDNKSKTELCNNQGQSFSFRQ